MAEPDHNLSGPDQPSDPSLALSLTEPLVLDLGVAPIKASNPSCDISESIPNSSKERDQTNHSAGIIKTEIHDELWVDRVPENEAGSHQVDSETEPVVGVFPHLQKAMTSEEVEVLSRHQSTGSRILEELAQRLSSNTKCIDAARISSINALKDRANSPKTIFGVVGSTGHGKSSLINVLLEETKVVSIFGRRLHLFRSGRRTLLPNQQFYPYLTYSFVLLSNY